MVSKQTLTLEHFLHGAHPATQQQQPQGRSPTPPLLLAIPEKGSVLSNNNLRSQVMLPQEPHLPECLVGS